jgi:hypothetical protein
MGTEGSLRRIRNATRRLEERDKHWPGADEVSFGVLRGLGGALFEGSAAAFIGGAGEGFHD